MCTQVLARSFFKGQPCLLMLNFFLQRCIYTIYRVKSPDSFYKQKNKRIKTKFDLKTTHKNIHTRNTKMMLLSLPVHMEVPAHQPFLFPHVTLDLLRVHPVPTHHYTGRTTRIGSAFDHGPLTYDTNTLLVQKNLF